ncbi:hypothetical protein M422DRAFT_238655 [Sphaerobolus stellatus SS14]|nr:hypothetical protein M422DRAFT_238655 [Sphaerobolus stellatus SS14]
MFFILLRRRVILLAHIKPVTLHTIPYRRRVHHKAPQTPSERFRPLQAVHTRHRHTIFISAVSRISSCADSAEFDVASTIAVTRLPSLTCIPIDCADVMIGIGVVVHILQGITRPTVIERVFNPRKQRPFLRGSMYAEAEDNVRLHIPKIPLDRILLRLELLNSTLNIPAAVDSIGNENNLCAGFDNELRLLEPDSLKLSLEEDLEDGADIGVRGSKGLRSPKEGEVGIDGRATWKLGTGSDAGDLNRSFIACIQMRLLVRSGGRRRKGVMNVGRWPFQAGYQPAQMTQGQTNV